MKYYSNLTCLGSSVVEHMTENHGVVSSILTPGNFCILVLIMLPNIDLKKFLDIRYIFEKTPPPNSGYLYLTVLFGAFILLALAAWVVYGRRQKTVPVYLKMQGKVFNLFFYLGLVGLFLIFSRWQGIPYLGSRFFMLIELVIFIIWGISIIYFRFLILPKEIKEFEQRKQFEKYLPRKQRSLAPKRRG